MSGHCEVCGDAVVLRLDDGTPVRVWRSEVRAIAREEAQRVLETQRAFDRRLSDRGQS